MKPSKFAGFCLFALTQLLAKASFASPFLVEDGQARSEILIARDAPRMVNLAASELQTYLEKISGAKLPIVHEGSNAETLTIYVGESAHTKELGIETATLNYGAYRMISGPSSLILIGKDFDFSPKQPTARSRNDYERAQREWDALTANKTKGAWGFPMASTYRAFNGPTQTWAHDEGGSLQAVYGFLRILGVRWYLPGELGEVLPELTTIALPELDQEVHPDFGLRQFLGPAWFNAPVDTVLWSRRLGLNHGFELMGAGPNTHGLGRVLGRPEMKQAHPEYYAMIGGKRLISEKAVGHACWSSSGLVDETVAYARTVFDHYDEPTLQLSPADGIQMCQCEDCSKLTPSDAVWGFLDRVGKEVLNTHPDRLLVGAAYTSYRTPPEGIEKLSPNIAVRINNVGRPNLQDPDHWDWYQSLVESWRAKTTSGKIIRVENNYHDTVIHPHQFARDLKAMKGISVGEMNEVARAAVTAGPGQIYGKMGTNHLNRYINARFLWDADQDIEEVLTEYYQRFYGPAKDAMRAAFDYAESNYTLEGRSVILLPERIQLLERLHKAKAVAGDSIYSQRIQLIIDEFDPLEELKTKLATTQTRGDVPGYRPWNLDSGKWDKDRKNSVIDGKLEEGFWRNQRSLRSINASSRPQSMTRFQVLFSENEIRVGGRCESTASKVADVEHPPNDDPSILTEDRIEVLIETDRHAYYRIVIGSSGAILDEDRSEDSDIGLRWTSNAEVEVHHGDGYWSFEASIPIVTERDGAGDPIHHMIYQRAPTPLWPWYFNVGRVLPTDEAPEISALATGETGNLLDRMGFAKFAR